MGILEKAPCDLNQAVTAAKRKYFLQELELDSIEWRFDLFHGHLALP